MQEITIISENKVGALADICEALGGAGVNIEAISAQGMGDSAMIRIVTADTTTAANVLKRKNVSHKASDITVVEMIDRPGELAKIARKLARAGVNMESLYILSKNKGGMTSVAIRAPDSAAVMRALK